MNLNPNSNTEINPSLNIYQEERPWGNFRQFTKNELSTVKIITVRKGESLSLQSHTQRSEFWKILSGNGVIEIGDEKFEAKVGDEFTVPPGAQHRVSVGAESGVDLAFLEIATGHFNEQDIKRFEDKYGRN
jgi:mannose-6-phosphate isomerase-like protein (cupin superfamily)